MDRTCLKEFRRSMQVPRKRQRLRQRALLALLGALWLPSPGRAQDQPPVPPEEEHPQRVEPGLEARRERFAPHPAKTVAMLPVRLIELPFKILNYPVEHWLVRKPERPLSVRVLRALGDLEARGLTVEVDLETGHSGLGGGLGYRLPHALTGPVNVRFFGGATHRGYQQYYAQLDTLRLGGLGLWMRGQYFDYPEEDFFGIGLDSQKSQRSTYALEVSSGVVHGTLAPAPGVTMELDAGFTRTDVGRGQDERYPVTQDLFSGIEGLAGRFDFVEANAVATWDRRDSPGYPQRGSYARLTLRLAEGVGDTDNAFAKYGLELRQYVPLPGDRRTLALRLAGMVTDNLAEADIPFYRLEKLGSTRTMRGLTHNRFTDKDMLIGGVEYRFPFWYIGLESGAAIDALAFFDFGTVLPNIEDLQQRDLRSSAGFGFRIVAANNAFVRMDVGWSADDSRVHVGIGGVRW